MIAKLKIYGAIAGSIIMAILWALLNREKAKRYKDKALIAKGGIDTLHKANDAVRAAEIRGKEKLCEKDPDRTHFQ